MNLLEAVNSPVSVELRHGKKYYTYTEDDVHTLEKQIEALNVIKSLENWNQKLRSLLVNRMLTQDEYNLLKEVLNND